MKRTKKTRKPRGVKLRPVFVWSFEPSGQKYSDHVSDLEDGESLNLVPQNTNPHDPFAIAVLRRDGSQIGWVPRASGDAVRHLLHRALRGNVPYVATLNDPSRRFVNVFLGSPA